MHPELTCAHRNPPRPVLSRKREHVKMGASAELKATRSRFLTAFREPFYMLATEPILLSISVYLSLLYALIYAYGCALLARVLCPH